jgi:hypothetical protein
MFCFQSVILETYRQHLKFETVSSLRTPSDANTLGYSQLLQTYVDSMLNDKKTLNKGMEDITQLQEKMQNAVTREV